MKISELRKINVKDVEEKIGYTFKDKSILRQAFVRSSFAYECGLSFDNEELEFIGDSVLGMLVVKVLSKRLLETEEGDAPTSSRKQRIKGQLWRKFEMDEAEMSKMKIHLVQRGTLAAATERLSLAKYLCLGEGEKKEAEVEESFKEDLFEAILGAVALDCDWDMPSLERALIKMLDPITLIERGLPDESDYEKLLSEWYFSKYEKPLDIGDAEDLGDGTFDCEIYLGEKMRFKHIRARALTKDGARRLAAKRAWEFVCAAESLAERVIEAVGTPNFENALMQMNMLEQKKIIPEVNYTLCESGAKGKNGNPTWICEMRIDELEICTNSFLSHDTKMEAKKHGAFALLNILVTREFYKFGRVKLPASRSAMHQVINKMNKDDLQKFCQYEDIEHEEVECIED